MCSDSPPPDPGLGRAAEANAEVAREALAYYKEKDKAGQPRQDKMDAIALRLADQQIKTSEITTAQGVENWDRYKKVGMVAEDAMYKDARDYDSQGRVDAAVGEAATDVDMAMSSAADTRRRTMQRAGISPADGRARAMEIDASTVGALGKADAMNKARTRVRDMGIMLRKDSANFAKGMQSNAAASYGVAAQAGAGATGALGAAGSLANQTTATNGAGFNTAIQGYQSSGNIYNGLNGAAGAAASAEGQNNAALAGTVASIGIAI